MTRPGFPQAAMSGNRRRFGPPRPGPALRLRAAAAGMTAVALLPAVAGCGTATGSGAAPATGSPPGAVVVNCLARSLCYTPRQIRVAYGIQPLLDRGIDGRGQTVVLMDFANTPLPPPQPVQQPVSQQSGPQPVPQQPIPQQSGSQQPVPVSPVTDIRQDLALFDAVF